MSAPALTLDAPLPRSLGRYTLFDRIGRGGMADIFLARTKTGLGGSRLLVVKQILPHLLQSAEFANLLITEAKLAARLDHTNVVQVHELGREGGFLYIAMQYVEGLDVNELLRRCSRTRIPLPIEYALLIVTEALRGLDYAHRRQTDDGRPLGIVHRDVSPSNILISVEGEVKLCDFGIARANDVVDVLPDDVVKGKAGYMSPEQARGEPLDARADVFAIGIVLWELLSGKRLYRSGPEQALSLLEQARQAKIPELESRGLPYEAELAALAKKALSPDREQRFQSAEAMLRELDRYVGKSKLIASPIRFGHWLMQHFGEELVSQRRARERAAKAIEAGPVATVSPIDPAALPSKALRDETTPEFSAVVPARHSSFPDTGTAVASSRDGGVASSRDVAVASSRDVAVASSSSEAIASASAASPAIAVAPTAGVVAGPHTALSAAPARQLAAASSSALSEPDARSPRASRTWLIAAILLLCVALLLLVVSK